MTFASSAPAGLYGRTLSCRFAAALCIAPLIQAFVENYNAYALERLGVHMRNTVMAAIFRKVLVLDNAALAKNTSGKIVTLMSNDAQKLQVIAVPGLALPVCMQLFA